MKTEIRLTVEDFIDMLSGDSNDERSSFSRKLFWKLLDDTKQDVDTLITNLRYDFERSFNHFKEEIAHELTERFSRYYWEKVEDGFDCDYDVPMIGYFEEEKKYKIGIWEHKPNEEVGETVFRLEDGTYHEPSWVGALPAIPTKEK